MNPANCWQVKGQSISNEGQSDGIYWVSNSGNLIHLSGWYNRVQVEGSWKSAANELGIELDRCVGGQYKPHPSQIEEEEGELSIPPPQ
jgi:hypothetical protein